MVYNVVVAGTAGARQPVPRRAACAKVRRRCPPFREPGRHPQGGFRPWSSRASLSHRVLRCVAPVEAWGLADHDAGSRPE